MREFLTSPEIDPEISIHLDHKSELVDVKRSQVSPLPQKAVVGDQDKDRNGHFEVIWHDLSYTLPLFSLSSLRGVNNVRELKARFRRRRNILNKINGFFRSGQVTAIMGPSGAGKSTLLDIICGRRKQGVNGEVRIKGVDQITVGYVPQDNYLMDLMTVKESFTFTSKVINSDNNGFDHSTFIQKLIHRFGLSTVADTLAGRCSGGQRKRLSIALEVISKPNILILDEPTTGLDSPSCAQVIQIMGELVADKDKPTAVVATIHQPSTNAFKAFDNTYILSAEGQCIYHGSPRDLVPTFTKLGIKVNPYTSPADYIIEVGAGDYGLMPIHKMAIEAEARTRERLSTADSRPLKAISRHETHPFWPHLKLLFLRSQILVYRDPTLTVMRISVALISALVLCLLFGPNVGRVSGCLPRPLQLYLYTPNQLQKKFVDDLYALMHNCSLLFCGIMIGFLGGLTPALLNFTKEMQVLHKEYHNGWYSCITYYLAKVFSDIPLQIITPLLYILLVYFYSHQPLELMRFSILTLVSILLSFLAQSIGECAGAVFMENQMAAVIFGGFIPLPMFLFGGFIVKVSRMPAYMRPLSWLSAMRFALEAMLVSTFGYSRCQYDYQQFLSSTNISAIVEPLWAKSLQIMIDFMDRKNKGDNVVSDEVTEDVSQEEGIRQLYDLLLGNQIAKGGRIDLDQSLLLSFYSLEDWHLYRALAILIGFMVGLKVFTYFVLLAKLRASN